MGVVDAAWARVTGSVVVVATGVVAGSTVGDECGAALRDRRTTATVASVWGDERSAATASVERGALLVATL